jgi:hypothetical protein
MFFKLAADLSGVVVSKPELAVAAKIVPATIINHQQNDPTVHAPAVGHRVSSSRCSIM